MHVIQAVMPQITPRGPAAQLGFWIMGRGGRCAGARAHADEQGHRGCNVCDRVASCMPDSTKQPPPPTLRGRGVTRNGQARSSASTMTHPPIPYTASAAATATKAARSGVTTLTTRKEFA